MILFSFLSASQVTRHPNFGRDERATVDCQKNLRKKIEKIR
jgi:hypothetical protein